MKARISVIVRVRPLIEQEITKKLINSFIVTDQEKSEIKLQQDEKQTKTYKLDKVLPENITQEQVYQEINSKGYIQRVLEGFHCTMFAYGQTGSGKTYTVEGFDYKVQQEGKHPKPNMNTNPTKLGIIPRVINDLFEEIRQQEKPNKNKLYKVSISYLQIYNEKIYDLLNQDQLQNVNGPGLKLRWSKQEQFIVENLYVYECSNEKEALKYYKLGLKNKVMSTHNLNMASSRSHAILTLKIDQSPLDEPDNIITSKLQIVDLAGSERQVITAWSDYYQNPNPKAQPFIPYRDSKLTCLLKQSIGGNSYCLMIACIAPVDLFIEENIQTLNYAVKASLISNEPMVNQDPKLKLIKELKERNKALISELNKANEHIQLLSRLTNQKVEQFGELLFSTTNNSNTNSKKKGYTKSTAEVISTSCSQNSTQLTNDKSKKFQQFYTNPNSNQVTISQDNELLHSKNEEQKLNQNNYNTIATMSNQNPQQVGVVTQIVNDENECKQLSPLNKYEEFDRQITQQIRVTVQTPNNDICGKSRNTLQFKSENGEEPMNQEVIIKRLIDSVNMVRDLLKTNLEMRELVDKQTNKIEKMEQENFFMQTENQDLRGKIEIMENILGSDLEKQQQQNQTQQGKADQKYDWTKIMGEEKPSENIKMDVINELLNLRKDKIAQSNRIKALEMENIQLQSYINPHSLYGEPARSYMDPPTKQGNQLPNVYSRTKTANETNRQQIKLSSQIQQKNPSNKKQIFNQYILDDSLQPVNFNEDRCRSQKKIPDNLAHNVSVPQQQMKGQLREFKDQKELSDLKAQSEENTQFQQQYPRENRTFVKKNKNHNMSFNNDILGNQKNTQTTHINNYQNTSFENYLPGQTSDSKLNVGNNHKSPKPSCYNMLEKQIKIYGGGNNQFNKKINIRFDKRKRGQSYNNQKQMSMASNMGNQTQIINQRNNYTENSIIQQFIIQK